MIKTIYLKRRFEILLNSQNNAESNVNKNNFRLFRLYRRTLMELYILNRFAFFLLTMTQLGRQGFKKKQTKFYEKKFLTGKCLLS